MRLDLGERIYPRSVLRHRIWSLCASVRTVIPVGYTVWCQLDAQLKAPLLDALTNTLNTLQESLHATR